MIEQQSQINSHHRNQAPTSFKISIEKLEIEFQCTICLNPIEDCYVTRCGHVYCKGCIEEAINRHHRCPFCNQQLKEFKADVFKNYHFNTIRKILDEEKKIETEKYLKKVFASDVSNLMEEENKEIEELMRPIEKKIVELCEDALLQYRRFAISIYELQKQAEERKIILGVPSVRDHKKIAAQLQQSILESLPNPVISPDIIQKPTQINVMLPGNKVNKNHIKISPVATLQSLLPYIEKICSENNVLLRGKIGEQLIVNGVGMPVKQRLGLLAGGTILISGGLPFESKVYCYTHSWQKGKAANFYICQTCSLKWICENCILFCHDGHESKLQLKDHKPDWSICYCVSKSECKALNKNSKE